MRQFSADFSRFWARRLTRLLVLGAIGIALVSVGYETTQGHKPSNAEIARYNAKKGEFAPPPAFDPSGKRIPDDLFFPPPPHDTRINVYEKLPTKLDGAGQSLLFVAIILGASFVGAEFNAGSLTSQLLYEPRRWRVYLSKGAAVLIACALFSLFFSAFIALLTWGGAAVHGVTTGINGAWINDRLLQSVRLASVVGLAGLMAYTVALVTKRTAAAIVIFLVQVPLLFMIDPTRGLFRWVSHYSPMRGLMVLATPISHDTQDEFLKAVHTHPGAATLVAFWTVLLVAISGILFARSEVR